MAHNLVVWWELASHDLNEPSGVTFQERRHEAWEINRPR
jgi:hypothetical protein